MDTHAFLARLDEVFAGDPQLGAVRDPRFAGVVADVAGFSTAAELAVLNLAARLLPEDEVYLEVGVFKGRSVCGALVDAPDRTYLAIENFMEFGMVGEDARRELCTNLSEHASDFDVRLLQGDCFQILNDPSSMPGPVGVYFYDGVHTGLAHHLALALVQPLLADEALVLVDDASWPMVRRATLRFLADRADWTVLQDFRAETDDDPVWANGLMVLRYRRTHRSAPGVDARTRVRRQLQVRVRGPFASTVWRTLHRHPGLVPIAKRLVPTRSRTITPD